MNERDREKVELIHRAEHLRAQVEAFAEVLFEQLLDEPEDPDSLSPEELLSARRRFLRRHRESAPSHSPEPGLQRLVHALDSVAEHPRGTPSPFPFAEVKSDDD